MEEDEEYLGYDSYQTFEPQEAEELPEVEEYIPTEEEAEEANPYLDSLLTEQNVESEAQEDTDDEEDDDDSDLDIDFSEEDEQDLEYFFEDEHVNLINRFATKLSKENLKHGVNINGLQEAPTQLFSTLNSRFPGLKISSALDGQHKSGPKGHYSGNAIDIGANSSNQASYAALKRYLSNPNNKSQLEERFGMRFIDEGDHLHFQKKQHGGEVEYAQNGFNSPFSKPGVGYFNNNGGNSTINSGPGLGQGQDYYGDYQLPTTGLHLPENYSPIYNPIGINNNNHSKPYNYLEDSDFKPIVSSSVDDTDEDKKKAEELANAKALGAKGAAQGVSAYKSFTDIKSMLAGMADNALTGVSSILSEREKQRDFGKHLKNMYLDSERNYYS